MKKWTKLKKALELISLKKARKCLIEKNGYGQKINKKEVVTLKNKFFKEMINQTDSPYICI